MRRRLGANGRINADTAAGFARRPGPGMRGAGVGGIRRASAFQASTSGS
jgi:hypothetical protein